MTAFDLKFDPIDWQQLELLAKLTPRGRHLPSGGSYRRTGPAEHDHHLAKAAFYAQPTQDLRSASGS
jgi:hypothetical protein